MSKFTYNSQYLIKDGKPWFPVMGEFHFSRYRDDLWEESLQKMKAGGLSIVSAYVIWNHHEEAAGVFDFTGSRNLRKFLEMAKKVGISVFLRLGPWVHGEVRYGGFPDWLQKMEGEVDLRSDDPVYLSLVRRYWMEIYEQIKELLDSEGRIVIGAQIENEYGHVGGYRGEKGEQHMRTLAAMAKEIGFDLPLFTATGWGGAVTGGLLPVMGGYCEAPWDQRLTELEANPNYVFSHIRNDTLIASDHHVDDTLTFDPGQVPFLTAELGGGLQVTQHRRPIAAGPDIGAMSLTKLGSGVGMLGYYMYHGGSNPESRFYTLQESRATGYYNDLPEINYDFNAPIRQYGTISDSYREIRLLAYFLQDFGADLAMIPAEIYPEFVKPWDMHTLRVSCRHDEKHGYIFINNYQRRYVMDAHRNVVLEAGRCDVEEKFRAGKGVTDGTVIFPPVDIASGEYVFFPYNMELDDAILICALATPLCRLKTAMGNVYVFYGDRDPQFFWKDGKAAKVLHLSRREALLAARVKLDQEYLVLAEDFVWEEAGALKVCGEKKTKIRTFPKLNVLPEGFKEIDKDGLFGTYVRELEAVDTEVVVIKKEHPMEGKAERITETLGNKKTLVVDDTRKFVNSCGKPVTVAEDAIIYEIRLTYGEEKRDRMAGRDTLLWIDYACESMEVFIDGRKKNDYFYTGQKAVISLGYFDFPTKILAVLHPLHENDRIYLQEWPEMKNGQICEIRSVKIQECF